MSEGPKPGLPNPRACAFSETNLPSTLGTNSFYPPTFLPLCTLHFLIKQVLSLILVNQNSAQRLPRAHQWHSVILSSQFPLLLCAISAIYFPTALSHTKCLQASSGLVEKGARGGSVRWWDVKALPLVHSLSKQGCKRWKSEQWSSLRWERGFEEDKWRLLGWCKCSKAHLGCCLYGYMHLSKL